MKNVLEYIMSRRYRAFYLVAVITLCCCSKDDDMTSEPLTQRGILQLVLDANPGNTLGWDIPNTPELGTLRGVSVNSRDEIVGLNLDNANLEVMPREIGQLSLLSSFEMVQNNFSTLPTEISQLSNLKYLNISGNKFTAVPEEIFGLSKLDVLRLSNNQISAISTNVGRLTNLEKLSLDGNLLTTLPKDIGRLVLLKELALNDNPLVVLPPEMGFLLDLETMNVINTTLVDIPYSLANLMEYNGLTFIPFNFTFMKVSTGLDRLISIYSANPDNTLQWGVDNYPEVGFNSEGWPTVISINNKNLDRLEISGLQTLEVLHASGNPVGDEHHDIGNIESLTVLTLHGVNMTSVSSNLGRLKNLVLLTVTGNPLTSIHQSVCDLQKSNGGILTILTDPGEGCK